MSTVRPPLRTTTTFSGQSSTNSLAAQRRRSRRIPRGHGCR
jgi:hypothetical protein